MKKWLMLILSFMIIISFFGCTRNKEPAIPATAANNQDVGNSDSAQFETKSFDEPTFE